MMPPLFSRGSTVSFEPTLTSCLLNVSAADLPQWRVVAGCIYQTVWSSITCRSPGAGINDYDVIYFDAVDL
jgi:hypothetical protein